MGHIKEPEGVDFIINSRPLTEEDEIAISNYIRAYKARHSRRLPVKRTVSKKKQRQLVD